MNQSRNSGASITKWKTEGEVRKEVHIGRGGRRNPPSGIKGRGTKRRLLVKIA